VGNISRLTIITAVYGRKNLFISNLESYNIAVASIEERPTRLFVFSESPELNKNQFDDIIASKLDEATPVVVYSVPPAGIYHALNYGVSRTTSDYLIFNHSDDYFTANSFHHINNADIGKYDISSFAIVLKDTIIYPNLIPPFPHAFIGLNHSAAIFKTEVHKKYHYKQTMKYSADWELIIRMYNDGLTFSGYSNVICIFSDGGASNSLSITRLYEDISLLKRSILESKHITFCCMRIAKEVLGYVANNIKRVLYNLHN